MGLVTLVSISVVIGPLVTRTLFPDAGIESMLVIGGMLGVIFGVARGFRLGGAAAFSHWAIRLVLARHGLLPRRLLAFLNNAEQRILMFGAGSGFAVPHRLIQEQIRSCLPSYR